MKTYLNLGSGNDYLDSTEDIKYINVDLNNEVKCDIAVDLEDDVFPWEKESIDGIIAKMILEHLVKRDLFMNKCWEVLKPNSKMYITVPMGGTVADFKDPTHVSHWIPQTFKYYTADWNTDKANKRRTWIMIDCQRHLIGDENEYIECILQKP